MYVYKPRQFYDSCLNIRAIYGKLKIHRGIRASFHGEFSV